MTFVAIVGALIILVGVVVFYTKLKRQRDLEAYSITPDQLHDLLQSHGEVLIYDVRQPLDLLAKSEIIVGATRPAPRDVLNNPSLIPRDKDAVVYCTCPYDKTSRSVIRRARSLHFSRVKFLKGGLAAWKAKGYLVEPYEKPFHLDTRA